jgi:lysozyme family protein
VADFRIAFNWVMDSEDAPRHYLVVPDAPPGAFAISGVNSAAFPEDFERIKAAAQSERPGLVEAFYRSRFWGRWMEQLASDEVAKRVMDARFNQGPATGIRLLQEAVNDADHTILECDGVMGPLTVAAANRCDAGELVTALRVARCQLYQRLADENASLRGFLKKWLARAKR